MEKQTQTLMLGDVDIGQYVKISDITDKRLKDVKTKLAELEGNILNSEIHIYNELYSEMISPEYPRIDLSFLEKGYDKKIGTQIVNYGFLKLKSRREEVITKVPTFSVYQFYGLNKFSLSFHYSWFPGEGTFFEFNNRKRIIPKVIESKIMSGMGANRIKEQTGYYYTDRKHIGPSINIESQFNGLIPKRVKEKVEKSQKHFLRRDICIVTETKPEEWNIKEIKSDPLVIGLIGNNAHLIDYFDTTPLENLVKDTYIKDRLS